MRTYISLQTPHHWVQVDRAGKAVGSGQADSLSSAEIPRSGAMIVGVVPGGDVTVHNVDIPARQRSKLVAAVPYALEESLSTDIDALHFSVLKWSPGSPAVVAVCARDRMDQWLQDAADADLRLDAVVADFQLLPIHPQSRMTVAKNDSGDVSILDASGVAMVLDEDMIEYWWQDQEDTDVAVAVNDDSLARQIAAAGGSRVSEWNIGDNFTYWLANRTDNVELGDSLLQGEYEPEGRGKASGWLKVAAFIFGLSIAIKLGSDGAEYFWLTKRNQQLDNQIQQIWGQTFPGARAVDPFTARTQMENRLNSLRSGVTGSGDFQQLLSVVSKAIPNSQAKVEEVAFRDNELTLTTSTADFAGLDQFKKMIERSQDIQVELKSSSSRDNRVSGQFKLRRRGA